MGSRPSCDANSTNTYPSGKEHEDVLEMFGEEMSLWCGWRQRETAVEEVRVMKLFRQCMFA